MGWVNQRNLRLIKLKEYDIMKQLVILAGFALLLSALAGCQNPAPPRPALRKGWPRGGVEVIIEGGGEFPEFLVGRWKSNRGNWEFVFEPDGTISSAVIALGKVQMIPGRVTRFPTRYGGKGVFEPGLWTVWYFPENRELGVKVVIDHFYQDLGKHSCEGNTTDILSGTVSEDGELWRADWFLLARYVAYTPEPNEFENMTEPRFMGSLIFEKVEQEKGKSGG